MEIKTVLLSETSSLETVIHKVNEHSMSISTCEDCINKLNKADSKQELSQVKELHKVSEDIKKHIDIVIDKQSADVFKEIGKVDKKVDDIDSRVKTLENEKKERDHKFMDSVRKTFIGSNVKVFFNWLITTVIVGFILWIIKIY